MITELSSSLTATGVIATLISVIFAGASFAVSHRRKTHHHPGIHSGTPATPVHHHPPATNPPANHGLSTFSARPATNLETQIASPPLFKMLGKPGSPNVPGNASDTIDQLVWE